MPCNAHGHQPFCECGWGGVRHDAWSPNVQADWSNAISHTVPNAKCPACSASVFFYRSSDSGAVFFDSLGPPWPKHPCTSRSGPVAQAPMPRRKRGKVWWPFPCQAVEDLPHNDGVCVHGDQGKRLYVKAQQSKLSALAPIWIRPFEGVRGQYHVATVTLVGGVLRHWAYLGCNAALWDAAKRRSA